MGTILFKKIKSCAFSSQNTQLEVRNEKTKKEAGRRNTVQANCYLDLLSSCGNIRG